MYIKLTGLDKTITGANAYAVKSYHSTQPLTLTIVTVVDDVQITSPSPTPSFTHQPH